MSRHRTAASSRVPNPFCAASLPAASTRGRSGAGSPGRGRTGGRFRGNARRRGEGRDQRATDPAGARRAHAFLEVRGDAEHRVGAAGDDPLEHAVDRAGDAPGRGRVVHRDDQRGPRLVDGGPDERQGDRGERAGPQAVRVDHVRPPGGGQPAQPPDRPQVVAHARAVRDLDRGELDAGDGAEGEVLVRPRGAENLDAHAPRRAPAASIRTCRAVPPVLVPSTNATFTPGPPS